MRPLRIQNFISNVPDLRHIMHKASVYGDRKSFWPTNTPIPHDRIDDIIAPRLWAGNFRWILYICVCGPKAMRDANIQTLHQTPTYLRSRDKIYSDSPGLREFNWVLWLPNGSHTAFSPISPIGGVDAMKQYTLTKRLHQKWGFDYSLAFCPGWREMHHIVMIIYDRGDEESKRRARGMMAEFIDEGAKLGMGEYRTHLAFQDRVMGTYNWNGGRV